MLHLYRPIEKFVHGIASVEPDAIDQARIKLLLYILLLYLPYTAILIAAYYLGGESPHLIRVSIVFASCLVWISAIYYLKVWRTASHIVLCSLTLAVWSNMFYYVHNINVETLQLIWFACALSFYMHGLKWGWFYSAINILPVLAFTANENQDYFYLGAGPYTVSQLTYLFVISYNFLWIIYLHYYFFKVFNHNFIKLTTTKNELKALNEKLKTTLEDLQRTSNARMDFLSTMSHELRTPLNGVIGISNALLLQNPREDQTENLAVLKFSAENLLLLINDVLDFNKFESNKVELEHIPFDMGVLLENNYSIIKLKAREKMLDLKLVVPEDLKGKLVMGDPTRLTQVLLNLLNNAIKFTERGSVSLGVHTEDLTDTHITLSFVIIDSGIGIAADKQQNIFEPFVQASNSTNRNYGGTGLGLPIVKRVLTMYNSVIKMQSMPNVGTSFSFEIVFPYKESNPENSHQLHNNGKELAHLKILVAEDNPINVLVIKKTLEQWNIKPVIAENGKIALQKVVENDFDIILMDLYMPEMDGYEAAAAIRKLSDPGKSRIPIIALTADVNNSVALKVEESGMNDYLPKPFDPNDLFQKLRKLSREKSAVPQV
ncbi:response regulator [Pedobacter sp. PLR]|uniref:response regulator n=1 Tax=Pedobacter sp. PLR TaxID=2994465 RepID=UPI002246427C|nr:response regulator [Pedobacter sp. PLR]MCX2452541.1 response regulator [Pedobacter sp. PLR]